MIRDERNWEEFELAPPPKLVFKRQCRALDAATGKRCSLLEHSGGQHNASGRPFATVLQDGATPHVVTVLDLMATSQREPVLDVGEQSKASVYASTYRAKQKAARGEVFLEGEKKRNEKKATEAAERRALRKVQAQAVEQLVAQQEATP